MNVNQKRINEKTPSPLNNNDSPNNKPPFINMTAHCDMGTWVETYDETPKWVPMFLEVLIKWKK